MRPGVLGPLLVVDDAGVHVPVPASRLRMLFAALLLHTNTPVPAASLAELVWDGAPPPISYRPRAVERMESCHRQCWRIADVVKVRRCHKQVVIIRWDICHNRRACSATCRTRCQRFPVEPATVPRL